MKFIALLLLFILPQTKICAQVSKQKNASIIQSVLLKNTVTHHFSHNQKEDIFRITVKGNSLLTSIVTFEIIDFTGKRIYLDTFKANYLFNYSLEDNATQESKKKFIQKRIHEFFTLDNFFTPAINKTEKFDPELNICGLEIWKEIKADPLKTGFYYLVGEENGRRIAYSKKLKKVIVYFTCC